MHFRKLNNKDWKEIDNRIKKGISIGKGKKFLQEGD